MGSLTKLELGKKMGCIEEVSTKLCPQGQRVAFWGIERESSMVGGDQCPMS